ncbi:MAG: hypothetical protein ACOYNS_10485, partial [Bacteroidota bacterium]
MNEFTYDINGQSVKLATLATPKRINAFCAVFGKTKLSELIMPNSGDAASAAKGMNVQLLDAIGDASLTMKILNACTDMEFTLEQAADVDSELTGRIATDFFLLLIVKYF